jgi:predicted transcriptional regulator
MNRPETRPETRPTGDDLRLMRLARRLRQADVAKAMGCSRQLVGFIESWGLIPKRHAERFLAALEKLDGEVDR